MCTISSHHTMQAFNRRRFLGHAAALCAGALVPRRASALDLPLGFMLHALRVQAAADLPGTLRRVAALGYAEVELVSFRGYASAAARDGFGPLAPMSPAAIRAVIRDAGLSASSAHFKFEEFQDTRLGQSVEWATGVGLDYMTVSDVPAGTTADEWKLRFDAINRLGDRVRRDGLQLALHTQNDFWRPIDPSTSPGAGGVTVMDALLEHVEPGRCAIQLDLSTTQSMGVDAAAFLARHGARVFALHLRDAPTPAQRGGYVFSVPLGQGELDLASIVKAGRAAGVRKYIVEMQMQAPADPIEGLRVSADYLRRL
jgi:sugar phosphate isomerase/epimerase